MRFAPTLIIVAGLTACGSESQPDQTASTTMVTDDAPTTPVGEPESSAAQPAAPTPTARSTESISGTTVGASDAPTNTPEDEPPISLELHPSRTTPVAPSADGPQPLPADDERSDLDRAIDHLRDMAGVDPADIEVVVSEEVTWPDGSIGCPQPGMSYTQAIVEGSRIVLRADGVDYAYHRGGSRDLFWCPSTLGR